MDSKIMILGAIVAAAVLAGAAFVIIGGNDDDGVVGHTLDEKEFPSASSRLWVYGNADEDDVIDENDVQYLRDIIDGKKSKTTLADANADGKVDEDDITYLNRIIKAMADRSGVDVFYVDNYFKVAKVSWPVNTVAIGYCSGAYTADVTGICKKVKMTDDTIKNYWNKMYSTYKDIASFGSCETPDYEAMMREKIDVYVPGYAEAEADKKSPGKLNPAGIDVMFMSTADNSGVEYPNEYIDRSIVMFGFLLQGDMEKTYKYLGWHDEVLGKLKDAGKTVPEEKKAHFMMARSSPSYEKSYVSITGKDNTNNIHAEWVGVDVIGQHNGEYLPKNYNKLSPEQVITLIKGYGNEAVFYMDNEHDGMRGQRLLEDCVKADKEMLSSLTNVHYLGMAREAGNSPLYVVELAFYQNTMYPELSGTTGLDYKELFGYYFENFATEEYWSSLDVDHFFKDFGTGSSE